MICDLQTILSFFGGPQIVPHIFYFIISYQLFCICIYYRMLCYKGVLGLVYQSNIS